MSEQPTIYRKVAEAIATTLLTPHGFPEGDRLEIKQRVGPGPFDPERGMGGWCKSAIIDTVEEIIQRELTEAPADPLAGHPELPL